MFIKAEGLGFRVSGLGLRLKISTRVKVWIVVISH